MMSGREKTCEKEKRWAKIVVVTKEFPPIPCHFVPPLAKPSIYSPPIFPDH